MNPAENPVLWLGRCQRMSLLVVSLAGLSFFGYSQQHSLPRIGELAPELTLEKILTEVRIPLSDAGDLKGKLVVLEFWATWCAPCVAAIPHLNELVLKFRDKPVRFVS